MDSETGARPSLEARVIGLMRSRWAGILGLLLGLVTAALLLVALSHAVSRSKTLLGEQTPVSLLLSLIGFGVFHVFAIVSLSSLAGQPARSLWAASQLAKYLPAPGASLGGMVHGSLRRGMRPREALALTVRHSGVLLGTAIVVGAWSGGSYLHERFHLLAWLPVLGFISLGLAVLRVSTLRVDTSRASRSILSALAGWAALGVLLWLGAARGHTGGTEIASAFSAAWVIGFIVLPVPAGIGIREAALLVLLKPWLGQGGAVSFAVLSRVLQIGSDGVLVAVDVLLRRKEPAPQP